MRGVRLRRLVRDERGIALQGQSVSSRLGNGAVGVFDPDVGDDRTSVGLGGDRESGEKPIIAFSDVALPAGIDDRVAEAELKPIAVVEEGIVGTREQSGGRMAE